MYTDECSTDEKRINCEKGTFIHFSQFIHFSLYHILPADSRVSRESLLKMPHEVLTFPRHFIEDTLITKAACVKNSSINRKCIFLGQNICFEVYRNLIGTFTPKLKVENMHYCGLIKYLF